MIVLSDIMNGFSLKAYNKEFCPIEQSKEVEERWVCMNRYQKILTLSMEDMANFLSNIQFDSPKPTAAEMFEWLLQEYDRDENDLLYISTDRLHEAG